MAFSPFCAGAFRCFKSASPWLLAMPLFMGACLIVLPAIAQHADAAAPPPQASAPADFQNPIPAAQLSFLNDYGGRMGNELMKDKRFRDLMKQVVPRTTYHYGRDMPLSEAIEYVLKEQPLPVDVREGRYVMVASRGGAYLHGRGFLWFDMQRGIAVGGFFFQPINGEPTPTLTFFSKQLTEEALTSSELPLALLQDEGQWASIVEVPLISPRYFIPENGRKFALIHDEDFCGGPQAEAPAPDAACLKMNADAADADMNAAYFMAQTRNAANATAWMLDPEQVAWIGLRDRSCGGLNNLGCRIQFTRQRTRIILRGSGRR
jgi:uncharacterized protein YecT (DUF1311 family)